MKTFSLFPSPRFGSRLRQYVGLLAAAILLPTLAAAAGGTQEYVALGDSQASGNGTGNPNLNFFCYRSSDAYAPIVASQRVNTTLKFVACQRATTDNVISSQVQALGAGTSFVTMHIGGNDVGFANLIYNCANSWDEAKCLATVDQVNNNINTQLPAKLDKTYGAIKARVTRNTIIMHVGYPRFFGSNIACRQANGISRNEAYALNLLADNLDRVIGERAALAGVTHISVIQPFTGHDMCAAVPYVNGKFAPSAADIYHPTKAGYRNGYAPLIRAVIG